MSTTPRKHVGEVWRAGEVVTKIRNLQKFDLTGSANGVSRKRLGSCVKKRKLPAGRLDGSGILQLDPCRENCVPACENSLQACTRPAVSDSEGNGARESAAGGYSPDGRRHLTSGVCPSRGAGEATAGVAGSDGERGAADTGWNAAQPSCGMAREGGKRTVIGGTPKVFTGVRCDTMW